MTTGETIAALDRGEIRVAEPSGDDWVVNTDAQAAILDYFRTQQMEPHEVGPFEYHDKIPLKSGYEELGVRVVPPAVARYGSFLSRGVDPDALVREHRRVGRAQHDGRHVGHGGSGAQIGAGVHLAGGVGIGGVLEPPGARPVIIEDGAFIGSRCDRRRRRAHRPRGRAGAQRLAHRFGSDHRRHRLRADRARGYVPPRAVVVPGTRPKEFPAGTYTWPAR